MAWSSAVVRGLHVAVLGAFAVAQPLFALLAGHPEFLLVHRVDAWDLLLLASALAIGVPVALALAAALLALLLRRPNGVQVACVALLIATIALPASKRLPDLPALATVATALAAGIAAAIAYARLGAIRSFVTALTPALLIFPALFLFDPPVRELLTPDRVEDELGAGVDSDTPIVLVVFDALPLCSLLDLDGGIDRRRHPAFGTLADESHWLRNATTVAQSTTYALPAILTGRFPKTVQLPTARSYPRNLFSLLAPSHDMNVFEPLTRLCPATLCTGAPPPPRRSRRLEAVVSDLSYVYLHVLLPEPWLRSLPSVTATWRNFGAEPAEREDTREPSRDRWSDVSWVFSRFLDGIVDRGRPALHFVHLNLPHVPYQYLPSGTEYGPLDDIAPHGARGGRWGGDVWEVTQGLQRHLLQVAFADALLGRLRERLVREGLWDRALVVVTADHGASFLPGAPMRELDSRNVSELLPVPLFVKEPGQRSGRLSERDARTVDILPTIVAALGGDLSGWADGRALLEGAGSIGAERVAYRTLPDGTRRRESFDAAAIDLSHAVARIHDAFDLDAEDGLFAVGPHRALLGRAPRDLPLGEPSPLRVRLSHPWAYDDVAPDSGFLPAQLTAELQAAEPLTEPRSLAIALNGVIRAVTQTYERDGERRHFSAMLPESAFRAGVNELEIFLVRGGSGEPTLAALPEGARADFALAIDAGGDPALLVGSDGTLLPILEGVVRGNVQRDGSTILGRALDPRGAVPHTAIVFAAGRFVHAPPFVGARGIRDGALEDLPPGTRRFAFVLPPSQLERFEDRPYVLALSGGLAAPLRYEGQPTRPYVDSPARLDLALRDGTEGAASSSGAWIPVDRDADAGSIERIDTGERGPVIVGRVEGDPRVGPPAAVLLFVDGRFEGVAPVDVEGSQAGGFRAPLRSGVSSASVRVLVPRPGARLAELAR